MSRYNTSTANNISSASALNETGSSKKLPNRNKIKCLAINPTINVSNVAANINNAMYRKKTWAMVV